MKHAIMLVAALALAACASGNSHPQPGGSYGAPSEPPGAGDGYQLPQVTEGLAR